MPTYEYRCKECSQHFALTMAIREHGKEKVHCPHCHSTEVVPQLQPFFAKTSKKS